MNTEKIDFTVQSARIFLTELIENINEDISGDIQILYKKELDDFLFVLSEAPAETENLLAVMWQYGMLSGIESALFAQRIPPIKTAVTKKHADDAKKKLVDDFYERIKNHADN